MRKIYSLLAIAIISLCSFVAKADNVTFTLIVNGDPANITVTADGTALDLVEGENTITATANSSVPIVAADGYYLEVINNQYNYTQGTGSSVYVYAYDGYSYTVNISKIEYDKTAKITVDDASKIQIRTNGLGRTFTLQNGENEITYSSAVEKYFMISPVSGTTIYKVTQNDKEVSAYYGTYNIYPENDVDDVVVTVAFPDIKVPVTFSFTDGENASDYNCLSSVKVNGEDVDLTTLANGLEVQIGSSIVVTPNTTDYNIKSFSVDGNSQYVYGGYSYSGTISSENGMAFAIDAHKYSTLSFTIDVEDASAVTVYKGYSYNGQAFTLENGHNELSIAESTNYIQVVANSGSVINSIKDANGNDYTSSYTITVTDGMALTIDAGAIKRDQVLTVNVHDLDQAPSSFVFVSDLYSSRSTVTLVEGENTINFYSGENPFGFQNFDTENGAAFFDKAPVSVNYGQASFTVSNGSVIDLYFNKANAETAAVSFEFGEGIQNYYISAYFGASKSYVSNWTEGVTVLPGCKITIEPSSYYLPNGCAVIVNGQTIEAGENGSYTFEVTEATTVQIQEKGTDAVNAIAIDNNVNSTVYNLQGVAVLRNASAEKIATLPAGLYIINGKKVVKK
jgi:hypothetical protein